MAAGLLAVGRSRSLTLTRDARGANLAEYIILVGVVALFAIAGVRMFGGSVDAKIRCLAAEVFGGGGSSCSAGVAATNGTPIGSGASAIQLGDEPPIDGKHTPEAVYQAFTAPLFDTGSNPWWQFWD